MKHQNKLRRLTMEPLEHRHLLATLVVDSVEDIDDDDFSVGNFTLREAIGVANLAPGEDHIIFSDTLSGRSIILDGEKLVVREAVTIDASSLPTPITIDAQGRSDVIQVRNVVGSSTLKSLIIAGGQNAGLTLNRGDVRVESCRFTRNGGTGISVGRNGSAIVSDTTIVDSNVGIANFGTVAISNSNITSNVIGIENDSQAMVAQTTVSHNSSRGISNAGTLSVANSNMHSNTSLRPGGGISNSGTLLITDSLLASNSSIHDGGGLANFGNAEIRNSLLTRNSGRGGGAVMNTGTLTITGSTLSGNSATWRGGGVKTGRSDSTATITDSTLTRNVAVDRAGGIHNEGELHLSNSIVAGNSSVAFANYFGTELVTDSFNLIDVEAMLRPLADNGGSTLTHALEVGSPAIDAGDPTRTTGDGSTPDYDQRGIGFNRIVGQRIDIGAFERQISADLNFDGSIDGTDIDLLQANITNGPAEPSLFDLTQDGIVDLADRDQWLWEAGRAILPTDQAFPLGDANLDGVVDTSDFAIWNNNKFSLDSNWTSGDFDADGAIDTSDFSIWNEHKFSTADNVHASLHIARPHDRRESRETHERAFDAREEFIWLDRIYVEFTFAKMDDGSIAGR